MTSARQIRLDFPDFELHDLRKIPIDRQDEMGVRSSIYFYNKLSYLVGAATNQFLTPSANGRTFVQKSTMKRSVFPLRVLYFMVGLTCRGCFRVLCRLGAASRHAARDPVGCGVGARRQI